MKDAHIEDTIAAVATARGEGGIGIIRLSGRDSLKTALRLFQPKKKTSAIKSHRLYYGDLVDPADGRQLDEALLSYMKAPNSFTREDVVEINTHGGSVILQKIMELILREGVREAHPGEFTKRAYLSGRVDLSQAEAVIDLIRAKTEESLKLANRQLKGGLKDVLVNVREDLVYVLAMIEAYIDFPEEDIEIQSLKDIRKRLDISVSSLNRLVSSYEEGRVYREGIHVVIAGRPNVGKSSLLNALLKEKRAIVTALPGTTRDIIEEVININGVPVSLIDTAGIRDTDDIIEGEGIRRTRERLKDSDLVLYMVDDSGLHNSDLEAIRAADKKTLLVVNKADLMKKQDIDKITDMADSLPFVSISAEKESGLEGLKGAIYEKVVDPRRSAGSDIVLSRKRHKVALEKAAGFIKKAMKGVDGGDYEFIAIDIRETLSQIADVAGETTPEDVLDKIFSEFCIGK